jgi:hypothetical protein
MTYNCYKCGGSGKIGAFTHIENGTCFTCGGAGTLSYQKKEKAWVDPHPEWLVSDAERATNKQWAFLVKLCNDNDTLFCKFVKTAGGPAATQRYLTKKVLSRAIDLAKEARQ